MTILHEKILTELRLKPLQSARELCGRLNISQPTLSRGLKALGSEVVAVGSARASRYVARQTVRGLGSELPIYSVNENGEALLVGQLMLCSPAGYLLLPPIGRLGSGTFSGQLPYWLNDLRPSGFLGRLIPKKNPEMDMPSDIRLWSDYDCLHYWATLGWDLIGDLVIGEKAFRLHSERRLQNDFVGNRDQLVEFYQRMAQQTIQLGAAGSSAGGEQPKFLSTVNGKSYLIKFSSIGVNEIAKRRQDLLVCEHLCLQILKNANKSAATSCLYKSEQQTFLELCRFDRTEEGGRRGLISLATLDAEFLGCAGNWRAISQGLLDSKIITSEMYQEVLWRYYFGLCIANSDMHSWNLSFYSQLGIISGVAPIYDMLPMQLAPRHDQLPDQEYKIPTFFPEDKEAWGSASKVALSYWESVETEPTLSEEVRRFAAQAIGKLTTEFSK